MLLSYEQNNDIMRFNGGFDHDRGGGPVTATGFNEGGGAMQFEAIPYQQAQAQAQVQAQQQHLHLHQQQQEQQQQPKEEEEEKEMTNCAPQC